MILFDHLGMSYSNGHGRLSVIDGVDLRVSPGEFVSVLGPSGCGKTTLIRAVAGLVPISSGAIRVGSLTPTQARERRMFGVVFQNTALLPWSTVLENVLLPYKVGGARIAFADARRKALEALEKVGLLGYDDAYPNQLSGGMQSRVSIARALVYRPDVLLMDEPFGSLDEMTRLWMNLELLRIKAEVGCTVLLVTHSLHEAVLLSDRIVVLGPRPSRVVREFPIVLPVRDKTVADTPAFSGYVREVRDSLVEDWWS